jgi:hypothetical protein
MMQFRIGNSFARATAAEASMQTSHQLPFTECTNAKRLFHGLSNYSFVNQVDSEIFFQPTGLEKVCVHLMRISLLMVAHLPLLMMCRRKV